MVGEDLSSHYRSVIDTSSELGFNLLHGTSDLINGNRTSGCNRVGGTNVTLVAFSVPRFVAGLS